MSPKWTTKEQEEYLESKYREYLRVKHQGQKGLFKTFWREVRYEWTDLFGWTAEDNIEEKGSPGLERVSELSHDIRKSGTDIE